MPFILGIIIIVTIVICKYINRPLISPLILLLIIAIVCTLYQLDTNKKSNIKANYEDILINLSKFVIITGVSGYIVIRIVGIFFSGFD